MPCMSCRLPLKRQFFATLVDCCEYVLCPHYKIVLSLGLDFLHLFDVDYRLISCFQDGFSQSSMKYIPLIFIFLFGVSCFAVADELILSDKLLLDYPPAKLISHTESTLIIKYEDWWFSHAVVNPKGIYSLIDFSGLEHTFVRSFFDKELRARQPRWMQVLAEEQAKEFGVGDNNLIKKMIGDASMFAVYDARYNTGKIYILEQLKIHDISVHSSKEKFNEIIKNIRSR